MQFRLPSDTDILRLRKSKFWATVYAFPMLHPVQLLLSGAILGNIFNASLFIYIIFISHGSKLTIC